MYMGLELRSEASIARTFAEIRAATGEPNIVLYNAGYAAGCELPKDQELLEYISTEALGTASHGFERIGARFRPCGDEAKGIRRPEPAFTHATSSTS